MMRRRLPEPEWIAIGGADRSAGRLDGAPGPARSGADIAADIAAAGGPWMLTGGEPTLRADLPALLSGGGGIRTDGLPLAQPGVLAALERAGLRRVRLRIHSSRPDAHDWLSGARGSLRHALRGLQACVRAGIPTEVEIALTRPTIGHLDETVALVTRLGARGVALRRLGAQGAAGAASDAAGIPAWTEGVPACMAPPERLRATPQARAPGCADCPADCPGYPADYAERLGFAELLRVSALPARARLRVVIAPDEDTRDVRRRLVAAAMYRPETLRVVGAAEHPARVELLRELLRLSVPRVELCGLLDGLASLPPADRLRLRGFARIDAALLGTTAEAHDAAVGRPGAFAATRSLKEAGCYGIVRRLPRMSPRGSRTSGLPRPAARSPTCPASPRWPRSSRPASAASAAAPRLTRASPSCPPVSGAVRMTASASSSPVRTPLAVRPRRAVRGWRRAGMTRGSRRCSLPATRPRLR